MDNGNFNNFRQIGPLVTIPFVLLIPIVIGWGIGRWLDKQLGTSFLMYTLLAFGILAGIRECYRIIKKYGSDDQS